MTAIGGSTPTAPWQITRDEIREFDPDWVMFWGDGIVGSQLETWLPYLRRSRNRFLIVSSIDEANASVAAIANALPNCCVAMPFEVVRGALKDCRRLKGAIYPTTRSPNFGMVTALPRLAHVWIGHGESEKGVNGPRTASLYDSVFVARYGAVDRFPRAIRRWVGSGACAIGAPIVEGVRKDPWQAPRAPMTIIYAPTWEGRRDGADYSSLPELAPVLIAALPALKERGITLVLRAHPGTGKRQPAYADLVRDLLAAGARPAGAKADDFAAADVMISDVSGVTAEFLFTEKPTLMPLTANGASRGKDRRTLEQEYPWTYMWDARQEELLSVLDRLARSDPLRGRRAASARAMYRRHRTIEQAVQTFDIALACARWRKSPIRVRFVFEVAARFPRILPLVDRVGRKDRGGGGGRAGQESLDEG